MTSRIVVRAVLALYPSAVRERYADEISDLLAASRRPWRDLADVARAALDERLANLSPRAAARWTGRALRTVGLTALAAVPFLFFLSIFPPLAALAAGVLGAVVGDVVLRWWLPAAVMAGLVGVLALSPASAAMFGDVGTGPAYAVWTVGTIVLAALVWRLPWAKARWWAAGIGGLVLLNLATIVQGVLQLDAGRAPREYALGWFWSTMVPLPLDLGGPRSAGQPELSAGFAVPDSLELLPPLMTVALTFILVLVCRARGELAGVAGQVRPA